MVPSKIPFNTLIVGPMNSGKSRFVVDQIYGPFRFKLDYIVLICPTFTHNKTYHRIGINGPRMDVIVCKQHEVEMWLKIVIWLFVDANTLIILDDCAASKDVKGHTGELLNLAFSAQHMGIRVWVLTQKLTGITSSFRANIETFFISFEYTFVSECLPNNLRAHLRSRPGQHLQSMPHSKRQLRLQPCSA